MARNTRSRDATDPVPSGASDNTEEDDVMVDTDPIDKIMRGLALNEESDSESEGEFEFEPSEQGLRDQVEMYREKASKKLMQVTLLNTRYHQGVKAIKALK